MKQTLYRNYQQITIQQSLDNVPPGHIPQIIDCILLADLCHQCKPEDLIDVTGIYSNSNKESLYMDNGFPGFSPVIIANNLIIKDNMFESLTCEDISQILKLSKEPNIGERIAASIAPSIFGQDI